MSYTMFLQQDITGNSAGLILLYTTIETMEYSKIEIVNRGSKKAKSKKERKIDLEL